MAIYARLENGTYAEVTGVYKTDGTEVTEIFQGDRLVYSATNEIYGSLPLYYNGKGYDLTDYMLYGNAVQDGTPSADAPVDAVGCGVRTGNLFSGEFSQFDDVGGTGNIYSYFYIPEDFILTLIAKDTHTIPDNIFLGITKDGGQSTGGFTWAIPQRKNVIEGDIFTVKSSTNEYHYVSMYRKIAAVLSWILEHYYVILNLGSTALPYEPYGFKLSPTVNGVEYPIYLGTVPTTRRIKKLVLTGEEQWAFYSDVVGTWQFYINDASLGGVPTSSCFANVAPYGVTAITRAQYDYGCYMVTAGNGLGFQMKGAKDTFTDVISWKSYLAAQYAAGTPVTVWYVLATPETAVVNEPLHKIGDYADTVSFAQAQVAIPTVNGANVLDMASPVKPSEVYIKGKGIKPTGYGQLGDVNNVNILDKDGTTILVHGQ